MLVAFNKFASEGHLAEALGKTRLGLQGNFAKRAPQAPSPRIFCGLFPPGDARSPSDVD